MLNELNNEEKINIIKDKIELHLKSLANGQVNFEDMNLRISFLEQEIDKLNT